MRRKQKRFAGFPNKWILRIALVFLVASAMFPIGNVLASQLFQSGPYEVDVTIQASPSPSYIEQTVTFTVIVTPKDAAAGVASGRVELRSADEKVCDLILDAAGQASCQLVFDSPAVIPFQAFYLGVNQILPGASDRVFHTVQDKHHPIVTIMQDDPDPSIVNRDVFSRVRVTSAGPIPSGSLLIYRGDGNCTLPNPLPPADSCSTALNTSGEGSCTLPLSQEGNVYICSTYGGDYAHYAAISTAEPHRVSDSNTFTTITSITPEPSLRGDLLTVNFTVTSPDATPSIGLVEVIGPDGNCSATAAEGSCQIRIYQPHLQPVFAVYAGEIVSVNQPNDASKDDVILQPSSSDVVMHRVNVPPSDIEIDTLRINAYLGMNTPVAAFSAVDANIDESHTYVLVNGTGDKDNGKFWISANRLIAYGNLPLSPATVSIRVMALDPAGLTFEKMFVLRVVDNEPLLPDTGFAPARITRLPEQTKPYAQQAGVVLSIPRLGISIPVVGVALEDNGWNTDWLVNQAGWLKGSAFPGWQGNSVLAGHNYLADGSVGPFIGLEQLRWGDKIIVNAFGSSSIFEVREVKKVTSDDLTVLSHQESPHLTLITCKSFDEKTYSYRWRIVVQAVLIDVQ